MPRKRTHRLGRGLIVGLMLCWVAPALFLSYRATGASGAGVGTATGTVDEALPGKMAEAPSSIAGSQKVMVLDFGVRSGLDPALGRRASDALAVSLANSGFDVVPKQQMVEAISRIPGVTPPLDKPSQMLLARDLGVQSYYVGTVQEATTPKGGGRARVTVDTMQVDAVSGDPVNGGRETAEATSLQNPGAEVLVDEAINQAAGRLIAKMRLVRVVSGTVLVSGTLGDATMNVGARNGVKIGDRFSVTRRSFDKMQNSYVTQKVGEVEIQTVESAQSTARILNAAGGIEVQDRVTRIFELPNAESLVNIKSQDAQRGLNTLALPVLALALLVGAIGGGGGQATGSPENIVATSGSTPGTVLLTWSKNSGIFSDQDIGAFIIHRSPVRGAFSELVTGRDVRCGPFFSYTDFTGQAIGAVGGGGGGGTGSTVTIALSGSSQGGGGGGGGTQGGSGGTVTCTAGTGGGGGGGGGTTGASSVSVTLQPALATLATGTQVFYNVEQVTKVPPPPAPPSSG